MIRVMNEEDLPVVKHIIQSIPYFWHECWDDGTLNKALKSSGSLSFVYEEDGCILGCIFAYDFGFRGYIAKIAVYESARFKGIGKKLVKHVENILRSNNCELIIADALESAVPFYKKLGWEEPNAILLRKKLL